MTSSEPYLRELDDTTKRLLEKRLAWDLKLFAKVCEGQIRRDYEQATREARARGARPEHAVGKHLDPQLVWMDRNAPYLKRTEEDWLKTFLPGAPGKEISMRSRVLGFVLYMAFMSIMFFEAHYTLPGPWYEPWIKILVYTVAIGFMFIFAPWFRANAVRLFGPYGCAWSSMGVLVGLFFVVFPLLHVEALAFDPSGISLFLMLLSVNIGLVIVAVSYLGMRNRIKQHYPTVCRILELPGWQDEDGE